MKEREIEREGEEKGESLVLLTHSVYKTQGIRSKSRDRRGYGIPWV